MPSSKRAWPWPGPPMTSSRTRPASQLAHLHTTKSRQTAITPDPHEKNGVVVSGMAWQNTAAHITFSLACASRLHTVYDELPALLVSHPHRRRPAPHPCHGPWAVVPRCYGPRLQDVQDRLVRLAWPFLAGLHGTLNVPCSPAPPSRVADARPLPSPLASVEMVSTMGRPGPPTTPHRSST